MVRPLNAYSYESGGAVLPVRVGGDPALDFCNTVAGWGESEPKDYLRGYRELVLWTRDAGLVAPGDAAQLQHRDAPAELARARRLRAAIHDVALGGDGWEIVAEEAERAAAAAQLTPAGWRLPLRDDLPVLAAARAGAEFLLSDHPPVRACPGSHCGWLFVDARGRRRWCSMATCGNREKQRRYASRSRPGSSGLAGPCSPSSTAAQPR